MHVCPHLSLESACEGLALGWVLGPHERECVT